MVALKWTAGVLLALATALPAPALEPGDVVRMSKARAGDEVIIAQIRAEKARFVLTADDVVRLKKEGVSDAVLKAMIERGAAAEARPAPAPAGDAADQQAGTLVLENLDARDYSVQVDPERGNIFFYRASSAEGREPLPGRASMVWRLAPGSYRLTWVAGSESYALRLTAGGESRAALTRTSADGAEAVYLSLFENGARTGGGRLVTLAERPAPQVAAQPASAPAPTTIIERQYYTAPPPAQVYYAPSAYPAYRYRYDGCRYSGWYLPTIVGSVRLNRHVTLGFRL